MRKSTVVNGVPPRSNHGPQQAGTRKQRRAARAIARSAKHKDVQKRLVKIEEHQKASSWLRPEPQATETSQPLAELSPLEQMAAQIRARKK